MEKWLKHHFGYENFKPGQKEIISDLIRGQNVFAMLPTGGGKSLCYTLPGLMMDGLVIIVSPLLSLMQDQVRVMRVNGEKRVAAFNSFLQSEDRRKVLNRLTDLKFLFVSPEMLGQPGFINKLKRIRIALFAVDEAHCISEWGHEFRPDYLKLGEVREKLGSPLTLAMTATADPVVRNDIISALDLKAARQHIFSVNRPNIAYLSDHAEDEKEKFAKLKNWLTKLKAPGLIYGSTRNTVEQLADLLARETGLKTAYYHGGLSNDDRMLIQNQFLSGEIDTICATNAFGMGINKSDIRYVIHWHPPKHLNSFMQETGRAGRDGSESLAVLLCTEDDFLLPSNLIKSQFPDAQVVNHFIDALKNGRLSISEEAHCLAWLEAAGCSQASADLLLRLIKDASSMPEPESLAQYFKKRLCSQLQELEKMKHWAVTERCRRRTLLDNFSDPTGADTNRCCDNCHAKEALTAPLIAKGTDKKTEEKPMGWESRLSALLTVD